MAGKLLGGAGFADAGFAGQRHHLSSASKSAIQGCYECFHLKLPTDKRLAGLAQHEDHHLADLEDSGILHGLRSG